MVTRSAFTGHLLHAGHSHCLCGHKAEQQLSVGRGGRGESVMIGLVRSPSPLARVERRSLPLSEVKAQRRGGTGWIFRWPFQAEGPQVQRQRGGNSTWASGPPSAWIAGEDGGVGWLFRVRSLPSSSSTPFQPPLRSGAHFIVLHGHLFTCLCSREMCIFVCIHFFHLRERLCVPVLGMAWFL